MGASIPAPKAPEGGASTETEPMRFTKPIAAALALTIAAVSMIGTAEARHRRHHHGDAFAAGLFGFAAGAMLRAPPPPVIYGPAPVYYARPEPWTQEWYAYCSSRYRSFNPQTGYFLGFDGNYHFCQ
jgi:hypothetical protein